MRRKHIANFKGYKEDTLAQNNQLLLLATRSFIYLNFNNRLNEDITIHWQQASSSNLVEPFPENNFTIPVSKTRRRLLQFFNLSPLQTVKLQARTKLTGNLLKLDQKDFIYLKPTTRRRSIPQDVFITDPGKKLSFYDVYVRS